MAHRKKTYRHRGGDILEVMEYHDGRYGAPGQPRQKRRKATAEEIRRVNQYNKRMRCWRKLINYFGEGDFYMTLTFRKEERPKDMEEAKGIWRKFLRELRKAYKKAEMPFRWIRNIEVGSRNGWHIHVVLKRIPDLDAIVAKLWKFGRAVSERIYLQGDMRDLAAYMTKTPETDRRQRETDYDASRNMPIPEPKKTVLRGKNADLTKKIRVPKGYVLDEASVVRGVNPWGYMYRHYLLRRVIDITQRRTT